MDIYLSVNNREQILKLPVLPAEFTVSKPHTNEVFETVTQGQLKLIGRPITKEHILEQLFPRPGLSVSARPQRYGIWVSLYH